MYIKEININGFKSFADRVNLALTPSFTGIVGPNGSGKSNIVDAIKWVLGEQSVKSLRGSLSMTDVIFNGSKSRNTSSHASVTIVFDNSDKTLPIDFSEVSVKRIVYRSGENEYYLNNEKCRLKDITNLFVDSFSSKESFNIIPQGKIDEILSERAEERRIIFEEAAGVLKYKKRKEESLRKLASTHENIDRIDMIIHELEEQLIPLKEASEKAKKYKESKESLENIEIALIAKDIATNTQLINNIKDEKERLEKEIESDNNNYSKDSVSLEKNKLELLRIEEEISECQKKLIEINDNLGELSSKKALIEERSKYDKNSESIQNKLIELKNQELKIKNELSGIEIDIKNLTKQEEEIIEKLKSTTDELSELSKKRTFFSNDYNLKKREELETKNKIELIENSLMNMEKVPYSVKAVLNNPILNGVENTISKIVETEESYSLMLEVALGAASNFVIVQDEKSAKEAINYLKSNNKGRVTFFPLDIIKPKSIDPEILKIAKNCNGYIGIASDLVTYDKKYYNIVMNQLGNIIVTSDLDSAQRISKEINYRYRIVSLNGELIHVGGSVTGGSIKETRSSIGDKFELTKLKTSLDHILRKQEEYDKKIKEVDYNINVVKENIYKKNIELLNVRESLQIKSEFYNNLKNKYELITSEVKSLSTDNKEKINKEIKEIMDEYYKLDKQRIELNKNIDNLIYKRKELKNIISDMENSLKKLNSKNELLKNKFNENELKNVRLNITLDNLLNRLNEEYNLTYEKASEKYDLEIEENEARERVNELRKVIKNLGEVNTGSIEEFERINKRYEFLNNQKLDLINSENNLLEIINSMDEVMKDKFENTFNLINKEFNKVFQDLFNGGEAHLKLTDPSNILETGIEIVAIPSGKTLKPISLLSGGEKTLTAISLLFAIMNLRHVPFAILDEVESALDEVNSERFGEYLQKYKNKTQLLIITHKKKTMEYVDLLYGITMQESGVSKLVSVRLEEIKN